MVYFVLILRLSEIRKTVMKLMDIARAIKARRTIHGDTISTKENDMLQFLSSWNIAITSQPLY